MALASLSLSTCQHTPSPHTTSSRMPSLPSPPSPPLLQQYLSGGSTDLIPFRKHLISGIPDPQAACAPYAQAADAMKTNPTLIAVKTAHGPAKQPASSCSGLVPFLSEADRLHAATIGRTRPNLKSAMCSTEKSMKNAAMAVMKPMIAQKIHTHNMVQLCSLCFCVTGAA